MSSSYSSSLLTLWDRLLPSSWHSVMRRCSHPLHWSRPVPPFFHQIPLHQVEMATCHGQGGEQDWAHTKEGKIIHKVNISKTTILLTALQNTKHCAHNTNQNIIYGKTKIIKKVYAKNGWMDDIQNLTLLWWSMKSKTFSVTLYVTVNIAMSVKARWKTQIQRTACAKRIWWEIDKQGDFGRL